MLDPHKARTFVGRIVFMGLCDRLVDIDPELKIIPRLATEWSFSDDGLTLTMKLRSDAKFHDGESFNAEAAKANIERAMTLLRRGDLSVTEICFTVGCSSLGTFSTRFTELVGVSPSVYRRDADKALGAVPSCETKKVTRPVRNREARSAGRT